MQQHSRSTYAAHSCHSTYSASPTQKNCFAALKQQLWCRSSHAATFMPPHSRSSIHAATFLSLCHMYAAPGTTQHFLVAALTLSLSRCIIGVIAFTLHPKRAHCSIYTAAFARVLCRWTRTTLSAFSNAAHDAGGLAPGRGGGGWGGRRGGAVFWVGVDSISLAPAQIPLNLKAEFFGSSH